MRRLKLQMQVTADGFVAGPNGELDWMTFQWDDALKQYVTELTDSIDTILLGRRMAEGFIPYWAGVADDPANPEQGVGRLFTELPKVVFSKTMTESPWPRSRIAGDLAEEVARLKGQEGKDLMVYGGASFVSALIDAGLIDELHLFVNPTAIGSGLSIFSGRSRLQLLGATPFDCGIVLLRYAPER
ncbi:MAG: dihydrofolate reductase [Chitinophagaceae bacterium]|nr:MAG: dihydrofolate reductase [Chitinophagaceae bacterium]